MNKKGGEGVDFTEASLAFLWTAARNPEERELFVFEMDLLLYYD